LERELKVSASYITKRYEMKNKKNIGKTRSGKGSAFWALRGISFEVFAGEAVGLIGTNGSGKSTLSNIISGSSAPTTGEIIVNGKTSIISIGAGLNSQLSGRENIRLKCLLNGMSNKEIDQIMDDIIAFSDLDDFIDQPIKNYSSGMKSRLGFAISVHNDPDILIIDEALSVGDRTFNQRCVEKIYDFKKQGKTIFFVSHSIRSIKELCDKAVWIHEGEMKEFGPVEQVAASYQEYVSWYKSLSQKEQRLHKRKQKKERKTFDVNKYYEEISKEIPSTDKSKLKDVFYPKKETAQMGLATKLLIAFIVLILVFLVLYYVPSNPFFIERVY